MRDPERIDQILNLIKEIWLQNPDLRFNQLVYNLQHEYSINNKGIGQINLVESDGFTRTGFDLFNLEDDKFLEHLYAIASSNIKTNET